MAKYHGKSGALLLGVTSGGAASSVANLSQWSVNIDQAVAEVTCLGDSFSSFVAGMKNAKASMSGFFDSAADVPFDAFDSAAAVNVYLYPAGTSVAQYWYGVAFPTAVSCEDSTGGAVTFKTDLQFSGTVTRVG